MSAAQLSHNNVIKSLAKSYCLLKLKHELQLKQFKEPFDIELSELVQSIHEEGISPRNINNHRVGFEKLLDAHDYGNPNDKPLTSEEQAVEIYNMMCTSVSTSRKRFNSLRTYSDARDLICLYFTKYFEAKIAVENFKSKLSDELMVIKDEIANEGIPLFLITYIFKRMKADLMVLGITNKLEHELIDTLYDEMKIELLEVAKHVQA